MVGISYRYDGQGLISSSAMILATGGLPTRTSGNRQPLMQRHYARAALRVEGDWRRLSVPLPLSCST